MTSEVTRPRETAGALDHVFAIQVDAPNFDVAGRLATRHHILGRPAPSRAGTTFGLVAITPPPCNPNAPPRDFHSDCRTPSSTGSSRHPYNGE